VQPTQVDDWSPEHRVMYRRMAAAILAAFGLIAAVAVIGLVLSTNQAPTSGGGWHFARYDGDGFSFDYPDDWRVISGHQHFGLNGPTVMAAVGIGDFDLGCVIAPNSATCPRSPNWTVPNGGVVLAYHFSAGGAMVAPQPLPPLGPNDEWVGVRGRPAVLTHLNNAMIWHFPGAPEFIEARWDPAIGDQARSQVEMLLATWDWEGEAIEGR